MKILIKSARILDKNSNYHQKKKDIFIENGKIEKIATTLEVTADKIVEQKNVHVSPAWFDSSVSFGEPGYEERETLENGLLTAAKSGFGAVAVNPLTFPVLDHAAAIDAILAKAEKKGALLYPIGALTLQSKGKDLAELFDMHQAGAVAFGDYKKAMGNPNLLKIALQYAQNFGGLVQSFPQENKIAGKGMVNEQKNSTALGLKGIPNLAEELQIARDIFLLEYTGGKLHIPTISTAKSVQLIKQAKKKGLDVSCSVAIHHLFFTDDLLKEFDTRAKVLPPLRTEKDRKALLKGLQDETIDMVTSDHCPIDIENKKLEFDNALYGSIGLESAFGALGKLFPLEKCIELLTAGKERFLVEANTVEEKQPANLSIFLPGEDYEFSKKSILSSSKNSIFLNSKLKGKALGCITKNGLFLF